MKDASGVFLLAVFLVSSGSEAGGGINELLPVKPLMPSILRGVSSFLYDYDFLSFVMDINLRRSLTSLIAVVKP